MGGDASAALSEREIEDRILIQPRGSFTAAPSFFVSKVGKVVDSKSLWLTPVAGSLASLARKSGVRCAHRSIRRLTRLRLDAPARSGDLACAWRCANQHCLSYFLPRRRALPYHRTHGRKHGRFPWSRCWEKVPPSRGLLFRRPGVVTPHRGGGPGLLI